jgi:histone H3/H4
MMISPSRKVKIPNMPSTLFQETANIFALATVQKLISELLPSELTFAKESRDLLIDCCVEFIHLVSSEANEICERETKKTISADHVVKALVELGFEDYVQEIQEIAVEHKEQQKVSNPLTVLLANDSRYVRRSRINSINQGCHRRNYRECRRSYWGSQGQSLNKRSIGRTSDGYRKMCER